MQDRAKKKIIQIFVKGGVGVIYPQRGKVARGDFTKTLISLEIFNIFQFCLAYLALHSPSSVCAKSQTDWWNNKSTIDFLSPEKSQKN